MKFLSNDLSSKISIGFLSFMNSGMAVTQYLHLNNATYDNYEVSLFMKETTTREIQYQNLMNLQYFLIY